MQQETHALERRREQKPHDRTKQEHQRKNGEITEPVKPSVPLTRPRRKHMVEQVRSIQWWDGNQVEKAE